MGKKIFFPQKNTSYGEQQGYTIVEILLITLIIGLTFSISLPLFGTVINKDAVIPNIRPPKVRDCGSQKYLKSNKANVNKVVLKMLPKNIVMYVGC